MKTVKRKLLSGILTFFMIFSGIIPAMPNASIVFAETQVQAVDPQSLPAYSGDPYVVVNDNTPTFSLAEAESGSFETYSNLDSLGRCGTAYANIGLDLMPTEERGSIGSVKPSGWKTIKYDSVDGKYLYNRCHLIGYQLSGENANERNLITGTRYLNVEGMLPFENMVADYIKETGNHVLYRSTPIFEGDNLLASGVQIEAMSVEDSGDGIFFNVYCYNVQPGISIDYATGDSNEDGSTEEISTKTYTATSNVNVRSAESTESDVLGQLSYGDTVEVQSVSGDWAKVLYNGAIAYVAAAYLTEGIVQVETEASIPETSAQTEAPQEAPAQMVWIPNSGSKYHSNPNCSNMKNPTQVTIDQAINMGYQACKKCY